MGPRRTSARASTSSTPVPDYDTTRFANKDAQDRYNKLCDRSLVPERGMEFQNKSYNDDVYEPIRAMIASRGWENFVTPHLIKPNTSLVYEFYANYPEKRDNLCFVRGKRVPVGKRAINEICGVQTLINEEEEEEDGFTAWRHSEIDWVDIAETVGGPGTRAIYTNDVPKGMYRYQLNKVAKAWLYFISARLIPSTHFSDIPVDRISLVYAIMRGLSVDVGTAIQNSLRWICRLNTTAGLGHGSLITSLCVAYGVPEGSNDIRGKVQQPITRAMINAYPDPTPTLAPEEGARTQQRRNRRRIEEEAAEAPGESSNAQNLALEGPADMHTQRTHSQLDYIIRQNQYVIQSHQALNNYMQQRHEYEVRHIDQLNSLVNRWSMGDAPNEPYFSYPPQYQQPQQPPPPPPF